MKIKNTGITIATYSVVILILALYIVPLLNVFNISLKTEQEYLRSSISITQSFSISNYVDAWNQARLGNYFLNSVFYTAVCTVVSLLMAVFLSFPISRNLIKFGPVLFSLLISGMFLPDGTIPQFQLLLNLKLYNTRLGYMLTLLSGGGIPLFFFVNYIKGIPVEFDEAASIDGCGYFRYIFSILIPLMKPAIASMSILFALNVWNEALKAIIYLSNEQLYPITRGLFVFRGQYHVSWTLQAAALIIVAVPIIGIYIFLQRYIIDGTLSGAIKA